ncbi:hypothetical protein FNV43_RR04941 [Rhamnella rubrinervis]|uniref:Uncharacterized protein n=1 Tax=Rhamnella rubrinervis TaxID=2594499 RepID=A0A8K0HLR9_9ROSA|nr:hypothetical protein FNV43_RR04941 [Rhamnella rubrinervis]
MPPPVTKAGKTATSLSRGRVYATPLRITAEQKNVIRALFRTKTKSLLSILSEDSFRDVIASSEETSRNRAERNLEEEDPSTQLSEEIPEGIPLPTLEVPYLHILEGCIRLFMRKPTSWASYPAADMGKLKMKISKAELEATKKKKKDKQAAAKGGVSSASDKGQERPTLNVVVEPDSTNRYSSGDSPPPRGATFQPPQDKSKEKQTTSMLGWRIPTIRPDSSPLAQNARYLYDAVIKVDKAFNKKAEAYINAAALIEKDRELEALKRDALQARVARWPRAKRNIYKKAAIDAILKNTNDMIRAFKAGQTEDWVTPDPSDEEEGGQEDMEITSGEDEPDDGDAPPLSQPEAPGLDVEPNQATSNDSFEEAMRLPSNEESGPGQTSHATDADVEAQD